jgi:hypothetical protein
VGGIEVEEEGRGGGERGKEKEEIHAIKSSCAGFGTLIFGSGVAFDTHMGVDLLDQKFE